MIKNSQNRLPNLLIIGVPKAGTTSLCRYLSKSNEVFIPNIKEPHFFSRNQVKGKIPICVDMWNDYVQLFQNGGDQKILGEASVFYFLYGKYAITEIKKYLSDDLQIILLLRNPIDRAFSAYKYALALNEDENLQFRQALMLEETRKLDGVTSPMLYYLTCGLYSKRLRMWRDNFPDMRIVVFDDLVSDPKTTMTDIFHYLNISPPAEHCYTTKHNASFGDTWKNPKIGGFVKKIVNRPVRDFGHKYLPKGYDLAKNLFLKKAMKTTSLTGDDRKLLREYYQEDILKTSELVGRDLSFWLQF